LKKPAQKAGGGRHRFPGTTMHDEDRYALELIQESCSDLGSRLFLRIREQLGLAYYVGAQHFAGCAGYFTFYAAPSRRRPAGRTGNPQGSRIPATDGLTAEELKRAKAKTIARKRLPGRTSSSGSTTTLDELYVSATSARNSTTRNSKPSQWNNQAVAQKYLKPDALVVRW